MKDRSKSGQGPMWMLLALVLLLGLGLASGAALAHVLDRPAGVTAREGGFEPARLPIEEQEESVPTESPRCSEACLASLDASRSGYARPGLDSKERIAQLEAKLERAGALEGDGVPTPWPESLDEHLRRENFEARAREVFKACPDVFREQASVDCSEYPCLIRWMRSSSERKWPQRDCEAFREVFGQRVDYGRSFYVGADMMGALIEPLPEDAVAKKHRQEWEGNIEKRSKLRLKAYQRGAGRKLQGDLCDAGEATACFRGAMERLGELGQRGEAAEDEQVMGMLRKGCELDNVASCVRLIRALRQAGELDRALAVAQAGCKRKMGYLCQQAERLRR